MLNFLNICICPIRVYVNSRLIYEGYADGFRKVMLPGDYELDYISSSIHTDLGDVSESVLNVNIKSFIDIYFSNDI